MMYFCRLKQKVWKEPGRLHYNMLFIYLSLRLDRDPMLGTARLRHGASLA